MTKRILLSGSIAAVLAVIIGAFGAHALEPILAEHGKIETFQTGVRYHMFHAMGILITGLITQKIPAPKLLVVSRLFAAGIIIFSGSLYLLSLTNISWLGAITPIGGLCFISGWIYLIYCLVKSD